MRPSIHWLFVFLPVTLALEHAGVADPWIFIALGIAFLAGGLRFRTQTCNVSAARLYSSMPEAK